MNQHLQRLHAKGSQVRNLSEILDGLATDLNEAIEEVQLHAAGQGDLPLSGPCGVHLSQSEASNPCEECEAGKTISDLRSVIEGLKGERAARENDCIAYRAAMRTALKQLGNPKCDLETRQLDATSTLSQTLDARERITDDGQLTTDETSTEKTELERQLADSAKALQQTMDERDWLRDEIRNALGRLTHPHRSQEVRLKTAERSLRELLGAIPTDDGQLTTDETSTEG